MPWWIYKCNSKNGPHQVSSGDWDSFFEHSSVHRWGSTEWIPSLAKLVPGDMIIAYQTNRNELVGVCRVAGFKNDRPYKILQLEPLERIGVKVRPLKALEPRIATMSALKPGLIRP